MPTLLPIRRVLICPDCDGADGFTQTGLVAQCDKCGRNYDLYDETDKQRFIAFADHYLPSFKGKGADLYNSLRSSLVHNYSTKGRYLLAWGDRSVHMKEVGNQGTYIDLDELVLELELALNSYWADLLANPHIQHLAIAHYDAYPILAQVS